MYSLYCLLLCFVGVNQSFLLNTSSYLASIHGVRCACSVKTLYEQCVMSIVIFETLAKWNSFPKFNTTLFVITIWLKI